MNEVVQNSGRKNGGAAEEIATRTDTAQQARKPAKYSKEWCDSDEGKAALALGKAQWKVLRWVFWPTMIVLALVVSMAWFIPKPSNVRDSSTASTGLRSCRHCIYGETETVLKTVVREMVKRQLRDPASAIFDGQASWTDPETPVVISRTTDGGVRAVCGRVNAKNGFGGYTGERVYIVDFEGNFVSANATVEEMQAHCLRS